MSKNPMKRPLNDIIFFCGFETETTIKTPEKTTYTLVDIPSDTKINIMVWKIFQKLELSVGKEFGPS